MVGLTAQQKVDVNFAIQEYMMKNNYDESAKIFAQEASVDYEGYLKASTSPASLLKDVLERKWSSIARLKKQVMELEKQCKQLKETNQQNTIDMQNMEKEFLSNGGNLKAKMAAQGLTDPQDLIALAKQAGDAIPREPEKMKLMGHRARITKVIFHPLYTQLATSSEDASIKIWDYETGECEQTLREHTGMINYICFTPTGENLASCSKDMTVKLWRMTKDQEYRCFKTLQGHEHEVSCVEYVVPEALHLISCSRDHTIRVWDASNGFLMMTLQQHNEWVRRVAISADGKSMASASKDETVIVWNLSNIIKNLNNSKNIDQEEFINTIIDDHEHVIDCVRFAPESACQIIQKSDYNKMGGANPNQTQGSNENMNESTQLGDETSFEFSKLEESKRMDEDTIVSDKQRMTTKEKVAKLKEDLKRRKAMLKGDVSVITDAETGEVIEGENPLDESIQIDTSAQEQAERQIAADQLKEYVATGSRDKKIRIFEVKTGRQVLLLAGHDNWVTDIHFHPNGKYLISCADDKSIRIWDLSMGRCYRKIYNAHDHFISTFAMRGKLAASGSVDTSCKLWSCR